MERLHGGLEGSVEPAVGGDSPLSSSVAAADVAGAVIKLCLHLSLSLISWRGLQQQQGVPDSQTTPPRPAICGALLTPCGRGTVVQRNTHEVLSEALSEGPNF